MDKHELKALARVVRGRKVNQLRKLGVLPANVFGKKITSQNIQVDTKEFSILFAKVGESTLIYLKIDKEKEARPVFVSDVVKHPVTGQFLHAVFHQVDLKEKVTAPVSLKLVGESLAEKEKRGILVQQLDEIEIEALPTDMPEHIEVDVTTLAEVGAHILVKDLKYDKSKLTVKAEPDSIVVQIEALAKEEVAPAPAVAEGEVAPAPEGEAVTPEGEVAPAKTPPEIKEDKK
jgi:large subunit ribosomal protein L25